MSQQPDPITSYQYAVARLTAENRELRDNLAAQAMAHRIEARKLRAQLAEGLTPELAVLRRQVGHWRERAIRAEGRLANVRRSVA